MIINTLIHQFFFFSVKSDPGQDLLAAQGNMKHAAILPAISLSTIAHKFTSSFVSLEVQDQLTLTSSLHENKYKINPLIVAILIAAIKSQLGYKQAD